VLYRHAGGNRDGAFTDWFGFSVTSGARTNLTPVNGVFWVVVELTDRELPALDANIPLTVTQGDLETITAINLHISQAGMLASYTLYSTRFWYTGVIIIITRKSCTGQVLPSAKYRPTRLVVDAAL